MIRLVIATPVRLMSDLIQVACKNQPDIRIVGCVVDKAQALALQDQCDVLLVSQSMPEALGLVQQIGKSTTGPAIVVMGLPNVEALILRYMEAGAAGCIREQDSSDELVRGIRLAAGRQAALHADLYPLILKRVSALASQQRQADVFMTQKNEKNLTLREREILGLIAEGYGNREIARQLTIELGTAKNHVHNILDKLNVKTRRDAAIYYTLGLV